MLRRLSERPLRTASVGVFLVVVSLFLQHYFFPAMVYLYIKNLMYLHPGSELWEAWVDPPFPMVSSIYLFNITNHEDIQENGAKPVLQEVGSFVYLVWRRKINVTFNDDSTLTYYIQTNFEFEPNLSTGNPDDMITTINAPLLGGLLVLGKLAEWRPTSFFMNMVFQQYNQTPFVTIPVREVLHEGYHNPLLAYSKFFGQVQFKDDKFSLMGHMNASIVGPITAKTGEDDIQMVGQIVSYQGLPNVPLWKDTPCSRINGTDGTIYHPHITRNDKLYAFIPPYCRSMFTEYSDDVVTNGIPSYRFKSGEGSYQSPRDHPPNECFCLDEQSCSLPSGLIDSFPCDGNPVLWSYPHFFGGDPSLLEDVVGLHQEESEHEPYMDIQPKMGYPVKISHKLQMNMQLRPYPGLAGFRNLPNVVLPIMWLRSEMDLPESYAYHIKYRYLLPKTILTICYWIGLLLGSVAMLFGCAKWCQSNNTYRVIDKTFVLSNQCGVDT